MTTAIVQDDESSQGNDSYRREYISRLARRSSSRYLDLIESFVSICTFGRNNVVSEDEHDISLAQSLSGSTHRGISSASHGFGEMFRIGKGWRSWSIRRPKRASLSSGQADPSFFLHILRTDFPDVWAEIVAGDGDVVVCVPQSTSLSQGDLTLEEARAHVLIPSKVPGEFETMDGWRVSIVGDEVVTGEGFPEPRRVRLLLSEDFSHYLSAAGQKPLPLACAPSPSDATASTAASAAAAVAFTVLVDGRTSATERRAPGSASVAEKNASASEKGTEGVLESDEADERGKGGGGPADKKMSPTLKAVRMSTVASGKMPSKAGISGTTTTTASSTKNGGNSLEKEKKEKWRREERDRDERRNKRVRLLHVSRPLVGGLIGVPESAGELDATTVEKYAAVFKSYPEVEGVFVEMDSFADAVISYCHGRLANGWDTGQPAANGTSQSGGAGGGVEGERGIGGVRSAAKEDKSSVPERGREGLRGDAEGQGAVYGREQAGQERGGAKAGERPGNGGDGRGGAGLGQGRPGEEKLCSVVAEQWRRSAAALTRSRCVKGGDKAGATEQREIMMMQVTESYLMARLSPGLGAWLAGFHLRAEGELQRAIRLLRHHSQEDIGVSSPFQCDLSHAVDCLGELPRCPTPMDKMLQIKECLRVIQASIQRHTDAHALGDYDEDCDLDDSNTVPSSTQSFAGESIRPERGTDRGRCRGGQRVGGRGHRGSVQMATDDLVLLLVCCILDVGRRTKCGLDLDHDRSHLFFVDLAFVKAFHFCEDSTSAIYFAVSTFAVALEWLLAKVGSKLAETPAQNDLCVFLRVEDRVSCPPSTSSDSDVGSDAVSRGAWGGGELSTVPSALCDVALRENVATEMTRRRWRKDSSDHFMRVEDWGDPLEALPWEKIGRNDKEAPQASGEGEQEGTERGEGNGGDRNIGAKKEDTVAAAAEASSTKAKADARHVRSRASDGTGGGGGGGGFDVGAGYDRGSGGDDVGGLERTLSGKPAPSTSALSQREPCDRVMVFGDSGERGSEQTSMFEVFEDQEKYIPENGVGVKRGGGRRGGVEGGGGGSGEAGQGRGRDEVDVLEVSCSQQCFAAVTRGGGLHMWGLDDGSGRLGHGPRPNGRVHDADQDGTGGAGANTGEETMENALAVGVGGLGVVAAGAAADRRFQLKAPSRVMTLLKNRVMQVSCGARHTLAVTADGQLFAWGDNRHGQCGLSRWCQRSQASAPSPSPSSSSSSSYGTNEDFRGLSCGVGSVCWEVSGTKRAKDIRFSFNSGTPGGRGRPGSGGPRGVRGRCVDATGSEKGSGGGEARVVVFRPTLVLLWQRPAGSSTAAVGGRGMPESRDGLPLRVLQVACGRYHSLAIARSRRDNSLQQGVSAPPWTSSTGAGACTNLLLSWGREGCGRLGRNPSLPLQLSNGLLPTHPLPLSRRKAPTLPPHTAHLTQAASDFGVGSIRGDAAMEWSNSSRTPGNRDLNRAGTPLSSVAEPPTPRYAPEIESSFNLPAVVECDWSYRVNDHREQGVALALAPTYNRSHESNGATFSGETRGDSDFCGPIAVAAGWRHSVAITADGATFVWGCGARGRLGLGSRADVATPQQVRALASRSIRIRQAAAGRAHTMFLSETGIVYSCGSNEVGQQGRNFGSQSVAASSTGTFHDSTALSSTSMPRRSEGSVGGGDGRGGGGGGGGAGEGEGGFGITNAPHLDCLSPTAVGVQGGTLAGLYVESIAAGDDHCTAVTAPKRASLDVKTDSSVGGGGGRAGVTEESALTRVFTWGLNAAGQCVQSRATEVVPAPQEAELLSRARTVGCGGGHTMVVL